MWSPQRRLGTGFARQRFVFRMLCRFLLQSVRDLMCVIVRVFICVGVLWPGCHDCQQSSRLAKILVEGKRYASKRVYIQHPALEREDLCHQVGFGRWSTLCNSRSVWLFKSLTSRVQWFEIGMSVRSQNSEYVVRFTSRLKLEPRESRRRSFFPPPCSFFVQSCACRVER